ncbi:MAG: hypothetical protein ACTSWC_10240 [Promethearchaeota archaeon]
MLALEVQTYIHGLTSWIIVLIGYTYWIVFMLKYFKVKKPLLPYVSMVGFCLGTFYLAPGITFLNLAFTGSNLDPTIYFWMSYVLNPVGTFLVVYLGFSVFQPKYKKYAGYAYFALWVAYWILLFGFPEISFEVVPRGEVLDANLTGALRYITAFNILTVLVLISTGFFRLSLKMKKSGAPKADVQKLFMIGLGWLLFSIASVTDAIAPGSLIYVVLIGRLIMALSIFLIFQGFMPPKPTFTEVPKISENSANE